MKMTKKEQEERKQNAIEFLRKELKPNQRIATVLVGVSGSGMTRHIKVIVSMFFDGLTLSEPHDISASVANALGLRYNDSKGAVKIGGAGMDMGNHLIMSLARVLFPNPKCLGKGCPSNDHRNDPSMPYKKGLKHSDGSYFLRQYWI